MSYVVQCRLRLSRRGTARRTFLAPLLTAFATIEAESAFAQTAFTLPAPAGKFVASRKADSYSELNGLGDVKATFELGGFLEYYAVDWFRTRAELRQGMGGHHGLVADLSADAIVPVFQRLSFSIGPRFTWESTQATSPYFGINATQALATGLAPFDAKGGAHSVGAGTQVHLADVP